MQGDFFIRLGESDASWLNRGGSGGSGYGDLAEAALRAQGERVVVVVPAGEILSLAVELPAMPAAKLRRAVPYALEEQFATEVDELHFALGRRQADGMLPVLAVSRERMDGWQAVLAAHELKPHACVNEALLLPWREGELSLLLEPQGALLRGSAWQAYSLGYDQLEAMLELALDESGARQLHVYDARGETAEPPGWGGLPQDVTLHHQHVDNVLAFLAEGYDDGVINLLQGEYSRKEQLGKLWRPWRASAALLAAWLLLLGLSAVIDYSRLSGEEERLYQAIEQVYRDTFPEARNIVNPKVQMERKLAELQSGGGGGPFLNLLAASAPLIKAQPDSTLQNLRYRQGELELELELKDLPALDALKEQLQQGGLMVEIRNATSAEGKVESRLVLREGGA